MGGLALYNLGMLRRFIPVFAKNSTPSPHWSKSKVYAEIVREKRDPISLIGVDLNDIELIKMFLTTSHMLRQSRMDELDHFLFGPTPC